MRDPNTKCQICPKMFYTRASERAKGHGKYCSHECRTIAKYGKCGVYPRKEKCSCGKEFTIHNYSQRDRKYCSKSCAASENNKKRTGATYTRKLNNAKPIGGVYQNSQTMKRQLVLIYGHSCMAENCGYSKFVESHHIEEQANGGQHTISNGILLCPNHHTEVHGNLISDEELYRWKDLHREKLEVWQSGLLHRLGKSEESVMAPVGSNPIASV